MRDFRPGFFTAASLDMGHTSWCKWASSDYRSTKSNFISIPVDFKQVAHESIDIYWAEFQSTKLCLLAFITSPLPWQLGGKHLYYQHPVLSPAVANLRRCRLRRFHLPKRHGLASIKCRVEKMNWMKDGNFFSIKLACLTQLITHDDPCVHGFFVIASHFPFGLLAQPRNPAAPHAACCTGVKPEKRGIVWIVWIGLVVVSGFLGCSSYIMPKSVAIGCLQACLK